MTATTNHWKGKTYSENSDQQQMVADLLLKQYEFKNSDSVLDVGCGDGKITFQISKIIPQGKILGIDPSESMLEHASHFFHGSNINFARMKASQIPFVNEFDVVVSFSSLHWEPEQERALHCFYHALKEKGTILLAIPGPDMALRSALNEVCARKNWSSYFDNYKSPGRVWTVNEYANLLIKAQFQIKKIELVERVYKAQSENSYKGILMAMLPHLENLPEELHKNFVDEVTAIVKKDRFSEGSILFKNHVIEVIAYK